MNGGGTRGEPALSLPSNLIFPEGQLYRLKYIFLVSAFGFFQRETRKKNRL